MYSRKAGIKEIENKTEKKRQANTRWITKLNTACQEAQLLFFSPKNINRRILSGFSVPPRKTRSIYIHEFIQYPVFHCLKFVLREITPPPPLIVCLILCNFPYSRKRQSFCGYTQILHGLWSCWGPKLIEYNGSHAEASICL